MMLTVDCIGDTDALLLGPSKNRLSNDKGPYLRTLLHKHPSPAFGHSGAFSSARGNSSLHVVPRFCHQFCQSPPWKCSAISRRLLWLWSLSPPSSSTEGLLGRRCGGPLGDVEERAVSPSP